MAALVALVLIFGAGTLAGVIAPYRYNEVNLSLDTLGKPQPPTFDGYHIFGTDDAGKDTLSQTLYGIQTSVKVALSVAGLAGLIGIVVGALAGYYGGWIDNVLGRVIDVVTAFPALLVLLAAFSTLRGFGLRQFGVIAVSLLWVSVARVVRASFLSLREREFVEAAHAMGASDARIIVRHLLPNTLGPIVVAVTAIIGQVILLEVTVDFFGFGIYSAVTPTLGSLVADSLRDLGTTSWWLYTFPAIAIVSMLLCVNYVADCLDEALNPRT